MKLMDIDAYGENYHELYIVLNYLKNDFKKNTMNFKIQYDVMFIDKSLKLRCFLVDEHTQLPKY